MVKVDEQLSKWSAFPNVVLAVRQRSWKSIHLWQMPPAKVENDFQLKCEDRHLLQISKADRIKSNCQLSSELKPPHPSKKVNFRKIEINT